MKTFKNTLSCIAVSAALLCTASALASDADKKEHRQHDAHEHGAAKITLVSEGKELLIELDSPAANILGFEHAPENDQQKALIVQVGKTLSNINNIVTLPTASKCVLEHVEIKGELFAPSQGAEKNNDADHEEDAEHDNHKEEADHDEHKEDADHDNHKEEADHKDHDDHKEQGSHSDVSVHYELHCAFPEKITTLEFTIFDHFENMHKIDLQAVTAEKQLAKQLTQKDHVVNL